ncbi:IMP cyclohydrolase [Candidatus Woesearchaeota archaeon]|nr:IMP cyclohydrolase [Candidatus Woesearchaeota archaeon]
MSDQGTGDSKALRKMYSAIHGDHFPPRLIMEFDYDEGRQVLFYEKVTWELGGERRGLRYGDNPGQEAAMYRLVNGNLILGDVVTIEPGMRLVSEPDMRQFGKHPGKTNLTDVDNALNILRYLHDMPACAIMKHNNPCGVAQATSAEEAYLKADIADRIAAFGGAIVLNRAVDKPTAEAIAQRYAEVVVAPEYEEGTIDVLAGRKNLRIMQIRNIERLQDWVGRQYVNFKSLIDGGLILETAFVPKLALEPGDWKTAEAQHQGKVYRTRAPTVEELVDMKFGWFVEAGVTSNSVIFVKDRATVAIGTGEQDRVGVTKIAIGKAQEKYRDAVCWQLSGEEKGLFPDGPVSYDDLDKMVLTGKDRARAVDLQGLREKCNELTESANAGLDGSRAVSDAFFPEDDGTRAALMAGATAIIQPGGSLKDWKSIEACLEYDAAMIFTGQRSFRH